MGPWRMIGEPSLEELFADEIMDRVLERDGVDVAALHRLLRDIASRLAVAKPRQLCPSCC